MKKKLIALILAVFLLSGCSVVSIDSDNLLIMHSFSIFILLYYQFKPRNL